MLDRTYNVDKSRVVSNTIVEAEHNAELKKTTEGSQIVHVKKGTTEYKWLFEVVEPYLLWPQKVEYGIPFKCFNEYKRKEETYLTHGVEVLQFVQTGDDVYVEVADVDREPLLFKSKFEWCPEPGKGAK